MRVVIAPDKFRGSLDAAGAAAALADGVRRSRPAAVIDLVPMADGGEGTLDIILAARKGKLRTLQAHGPLMETRTGAVGLIDGAATAVIELAQIAGLALISPQQRDPLRTTTYGVGELISAALDSGVQQIILAVGGSASVDGGAGMMQALGVHLLDRSGRPLPTGIGGGRLSDIHFVSAESLGPLRAEGIVLTLAVDALNPLTGPTGAAAVFAPQKGADARGVAVLETGLAHWADLLENFSGCDIRGRPGTGAAGGVAAPLVALADAQIVPGVDLVIDAVNLRERIIDADLVITGEGRLDGQSLMGKVVGGVARLARSAGVPCVGVAGELGEGHERCDAWLDQYVSLTDIAGSKADAMQAPAAWIATAVTKILATVG